MTGNEYQSLALVTAATLDDEQLLLNGALGLNGEAGEVADIIKKATFQGHGLDRLHIKEELGDVMWYVAITAKAIGVDLDEVMEVNIDKLKARFPEGFSAERSIRRDV